jgi:hypothetical protein
MKYLQRPDLVLPLLSGWCLFALALSYVLFILVARFVDSRRETLGQYS